MDSVKGTVVLNMGQRYVYVGRVRTQSVIKRYFLLALQIYGTTNSSLVVVNIGMLFAVEIKLVYLEIKL